MKRMTPGRIVTADGAASDRRRQRGQVSHRRHEEDDIRTSCEGRWRGIAGDREGRCHIGDMKRATSGRAMTIGGAASDRRRQRGQVSHRRHEEDDIRTSCEGRWRGIAGDREGRCHIGDMKRATSGRAMTIGGAASDRRRQRGQVSHRRHEEDDIRTSYDDRRRGIRSPATEGMSG